MTDNIVIARELVDSMKKLRSRKGFMSLKLDMSKDFGRIEGPFLLIF